MVFHELIGHLLRETAAVHAAQVVVAQAFDELVRLVAVVAGVEFRTPEVRLQFVAHVLGLLPPLALLAVAQQPRHFRQCVACDVGVRHDIHGLNRNVPFRIVRRGHRVLHDVRRAVEAGRLILARIADPPHFKTTIAVRIAVFPEKTIVGFESPVGAFEKGLVFA